MTATEFNALSLTSKLEYLEREEATFLDRHYFVGPYKVCLFELFGFYVSVYYNRQTDHITKATAFSDTNKLDAFTSSIDLGDIYWLLK